MIDRAAGGRPSMADISRRGADVAIVAIILLGVILRLVQYFGATSLWYHRDDPRSYFRELDRFRGRSRVWFFHTHAALGYREPEVIRSYLATMGVLRDSIPDPYGLTGQREAAGPICMTCPTPPASRRRRRTRSSTSRSRREASASSATEHAWAPPARTTAGPSRDADGTLRFVQGPLGASEVLPARGAVSLPWLVRLRWGVLAAQAVTVATGSAILDSGPPLSRGLALLALTFASNVALGRPAVAARASGPALCGSALALDTVVLTLLLRGSGGPANPFSVLYLVGISLSAVVLGSRWTWMLTLLAVAGYGSLFLGAQAPPPEALHHSFASHLQGMWVAFVVAAVLTAYFVSQLAGAVERRDQEIAAVRERALRYERVASLSTLAAGAAHELGTPLASIGVAARELELALERLPDGGSLVDDARLIRAELGRCRAVLDNVAAHSGEVVGEAPIALTPAEIVEDVRRRLGTALAARVEVQEPLPAETLKLPREAFGRAVYNLVRNAIDASPGQSPVRVAARIEDGRMTFIVEDRGTGMAPDVLERAAEPFFTTKAPGAGLGLGLFLTRTLAEQLGGSLALESAPGRGTQARLALPLSGQGSLR
jgi:two-component system sensor histidine kinase RegB